MKPPSPAETTLNGTMPPSTMPPRQSLAQHADIADAVLQD